MIGKGPFAACFAAGAALALTLPKPGLCLLAWIAPAFLFYLTRRCGSAAAAAALGGLFGFAYCFVSLFWIYFTCRFAGVPVPVSLLAMTALAAVLAVSWALYGAAVRFVSGRLPAPALPWAWAALWTAIEAAGAHWTPRVGVDLLAYTQYRCLPLIQIGALLGPHGLAFAIMLWNGALSEFWAERRSVPRRRNLAAAGVLAALFAVYGAAVLSQRERGGEGLRVEILQPNIDPYQKWDMDFEESIRRAFEDLLARPREAPPDLVIWPESALPGWIDDERSRGWVAAHARRAGAPMVVGAVSRRPSGRHNSAVYFDAKGGIVQYYHKRQLVPFGEFVPLRSMLQGWIGILAQMGDFDAGLREQDLMEAGGTRLAADICYEAVFPHLLRVDSARGARIFVNLTNDGWYEDTAGPYQHFYTNMFRAVENRVTVIRAANTGISGVIDPYGVILRRTRLGEQVRLDAILPEDDPFPRGSFYSRNGDLWGFICMAASFAFLLWPVGGK